MYNRKDLKAVSKAYRRGKIKGGMKDGHKRALEALVSRHPELGSLDDATLTLRVSQALSTAVLARYLSI